MRENMLGTEKISKLLRKFLIPAVVAMVIAGTQTIIDGIFLGNFVGETALASINIVQPFMQLIIGVGMIISVGSLSFIGRNLGEGKKEEARDIFKTVFIVTLILTLMITLLGVFFSDSIAMVLGANDILKTGVSEYIRVISIFAPIMCIMFLFGFINRVIGKPELYLKGTILSVVTNVTLDFVLIKELGLGIKGAAFATGIAYTSALLVVIWPMLDRENIVNVFVGKFNKDVILPVVYNGSSEGVNSIAAAITAYVFNVTFMRIAGASGVAAFTSINYISQFGALIMFGISDGITPIVSYNYGNGNFDRVDKTLKIALKLNFAIGISLFLVLFGFGENLIGLFANGNVDILEIAVGGSKIYAFAFLIIGFNIINSGYFTAIGDARGSIIVAACRGIVFIILGIIILPKFMGIGGVWFTVPFSEFATFLIGIYLLKNNSSEIAKLEYNLKGVI